MSTDAPNDRYRRHPGGGAEFDIRRQGLWMCLFCRTDSRVDPQNPGRCPKCGREFWHRYVDVNGPEFPPYLRSYNTDDPSVSVGDREVIVRREHGWRWFIVRTIDGYPIAKGQPHGSPEDAEQDFLTLFAAFADGIIKPEIDRRLQMAGAMAKVDARTRQLTTLRDMLGRSKGEIEKALPRHIKAEYMLRVVMTSIQVNPELLQCEPKSVLECVMKCSQLGLAPDGIMGEAYLIPFKDRKAGVTRCTLIPGYRGLQELARRSGYVTKIFARVVHEGDTYEIEEGLRPVLRHVPVPEAKRGRAVAYYAVATFRDRDTDPQFVWMWRDDVDAHRKRFASSRSGPWETDYDAMARKTVIRKLCNELPKARELQDLHAALEAEEKSITDVEWSVADTPYSEPEKVEEVIDVPGQDKDAVEELSERINLAETLAELDGVVAELDGKFAFLPPGTQDEVRQLAADKKAAMRTSS